MSALPVNLRIACDGEEEIGGHSIVEFLEQDERGADACIIFDGGMTLPELPEFGIATRGLVAIHAKVRTGERDLHSGYYGGAALNAIHALMQALSGVLARGGLLPDELRVGAPAAHRARGRKPEAAAFGRGKSWRTREQGRSTPRRQRSSTTDVGRTVARRERDLRRGKPDFINTTLVVEARARFTIRLAPGQDPDAIYRSGRAAAARALPEGAELEVERESSAPPGVFSPDLPAISSAWTRSSARSVRAPSSCVSGGTLPIYPALAEKGIPTIGTGFALRESNVIPRTSGYACRTSTGQWPPRRSCTGASPPLADPRYRTPLAEELAEDVLERFLRYVRIDTQSEQDSDTYPSTAKQRDLGELLERELRELGLDEVRLTEHGYVFATLPGSSGPTVGLIAHMDTSEDESGTNVQPQVVRNWDGGDIVLPGDPRQILRPAENPTLAERVGHDIVTTDGTTLLGADDKAGVAEIMGAVAYLAAHPEIEHAPIRVGFTVDEEVGRGVATSTSTNSTRTSPTRSTARRSGGSTTRRSTPPRVRICHRRAQRPSGHVEGKMVNAIKLAARLVELLPQDATSPETTEGREGFVHPTKISGTTAEAEVRFIARDFDAAKLAAHESLLRRLADELAAAEPAQACR